MFLNLGKERDVSGFTFSGQEEDSDNDTEIQTRSFVKACVKSTCFNLDKLYYVQNKYLIKIRCIAEFTYYPNLLSFMQIIKS